MIENLEEIKQADINQYLDKLGIITDTPTERGDTTHYFCPIHNGDHGQNFVVYGETNSWHCHTECDNGGDIFNLHAELHNLDRKNDFQRIAEEVAAISGIEVRYTGATKSYMPQHSIKAQPVKDEIKKILQRHADKVEKETKRTPQLVLETSKPYKQHSYFEKKCVEPCEGLYEGVDESYYKNKSIIVPFYTVKNKLKSVQFVHENGKPFCEKGIDGEYSPKEAFFTIGEFKDGDTVYIGEGIATVLTCWMALDKKVPAISYGASWNCQPVINVLMKEYPNLKLIHLLDNDKNETALKIACVFVNYPNISFREPSFEGLNSTLNENGKGSTDFNDLISKCGQPLSKVKEQLTSELPELRKKLMEKYTSRKQPEKTVPNTENLPQTTDDLNKTETTVNNPTQKELDISQPKKLKLVDMLENVISTIKIKNDKYVATGEITLSGIPTGYDKLDDLLDGFQDGQLIICAARAKMGKSWGILNFIKNISIDGILIEGKSQPKQTVPTALFSLEMSDRQILHRLLSLCSGIPAKEIKRGTFKLEEWPSLETARKKISDSKLLLCCDPSNNILETLLDRIDEIVLSHGAKIIFIDHIGLISSEKFKNNSNRVQEVSNTTRQLKLAAEKHKISIICASQLNRNADKDEDPILSNLRESGSIEQDADVVIFFHRSDYFDERKNPGEIYFKVAANRDGETGKITFERDNLWRITELIESNSNNSDTFKKKPNEKQQNESPKQSIKQSKKINNTDFILACIEKELHE